MLFERTQRKINLMKNPLAYTRVIDKVRLPEAYDRRKKLTAAQKDTIRQLYAQGGHSYRTLARKYGVAYGTIQTTIDEERRIKNLAIARAYRARTKRPASDPMELRRRKKELIEQGIITLESY